MMKLPRILTNRDLLAERILFVVTAFGVPLDGFFAGAFSSGSPEHFLNRLLLSANGILFLFLSYNTRINRRQIRYMAMIIIYMFLLQITYLNYVYRFDINNILLLSVMMILSGLYFNTVGGLLIYLLFGLVLTTTTILLVDDPIVDEKTFITRFILGEVISFGLSRAYQVFQRRLRLFAEKMSDQNAELQEVRARLEKTAASSQLLALVAGTAPNAIIITDKNDVIEWVNQGFTRITGYSAEECIGKNPSFLRGPLTDSATTQSIREKAAGGQPFSEDILNYRKDGTPIWLHIHVTPVFNDKGELDKFISIQEDITGNRQFVESLRQSTEQLHEAQRLAKIGTWNYNPETGLMQCSTEVNDIFGIERAKEISFSSYERFIHPEDLPLFQQSIRYDIDRKSPFELDHRIIVDGRIKYLFCIGENIPEPGGKSRRLFVTIQDITDRKRVEEELHLTELRFRRLFSNAQNLICTHGPDGTIFSINPLGAQTLGYEPEELIGRSLRILVADDKTDLFEQYLRNVIDTGFAKGIMKTKHRDGSTMFWMYRNSLLDDVDGKPYVLASGVDVTEQFKIERELKHAKELAEAALVSKERFVANISHEMRTPMNAIIGFSEMLQRQQLNPEQRQWVEAVRTASENLLAIVNDILDLSKIEAGKIEFENRPYNLREIMADVERLLTLRAQGKEISLTYNFQPDVPEYVSGDPLKLTQVLLNLVGNAIKFTEKGYVEYSCALAEKSENSLLLKFTVRDSGIGIAKDKLLHIFEPFAQAGEGADRRHGGTGLGLSISQNLVELQGGEIKVESEQGKGSTFTFTLPVSTIGIQEIKEMEQALDLTASDRSLNILLAEDHPLNQQLGKKLITDFGFHVALASNGLEALELLRNEKFDLVLMDLSMPEMDGYTAASQIRNVLKLDVPLIAVTAHSMAGERERCLAIGMNDYLTKPFRARDLYMKIVTNVSRSVASNVPQDHQRDVSPLLALSGGDKNFEREMLHLLFNSIPADFDVMAKSILSGDLPRARATAHRLRSAVALAGYHAFAELLSLTENDQTANTSLMNERLEQMKPMLEKLTNEIGEMLKEFE